MTELRSRLAIAPVGGNWRNWRGPGVRSGKTTNDLLDPIISDYRRIKPWRSSFTRSDMETDGWIVYNTPGEITERIKSVNIVYDDPGQTDLPLHPPPPGPPQVPSDILYCFEGATGAVGMVGDPTPTAGDLDPAWSIMGFVLARAITNADIKRTTATAAPLVEAGYDIYITFRGSRSGLLRLMEAKSSKAGNPDWVTDLELLRHIQDDEINPHGLCARGFRTCIKHTLPNVMECLKKIHIRKNGPPRSIYVTGHSLGGALAADFASAVLLGKKYGPNGLGQAMPDEIKIWPWRATWVVTFASPGVGDEAFQQKFDEVINSSRVWVYGDLITSQVLSTQVGEGYHLNKLGKGHVALSPSEAHDPRFIRRFLIQERLSKGFDMTGTPANSGNPQFTEPWRVFPSCRSAFDHIKSCHQNQQPAFTFADVLPNFDDEFARYTLVVAGALQSLGDPAFKTKRSELDKLHNYLQAPDAANYTAQTRLQALFALWGDLGNVNILPDWAESKKQGMDSRFSRFFGLCLFLSGLRRDNNLLQNLGPMQSPAAAAFNALLDSVF
jgi:hypothetical protein